MAVNVLNHFGEHSIYVYTLAIFATVIAVVMSTVYLLRRLFKFRAVGKSSDDQKEVRRRKGNVCPSARCCDDDGGREDDDDTEDQGETILTKETLNNSQHLSPRYQDPVEYCEHIQGEFKRVQQSVATRTIEKSLTDQQLQEEKEVQRRQLGEIFRLMQEQQDRFGIGTVDDMQEQMKLYAL